MASESQTLNVDATSAILGKTYDISLEDLPNDALTMAKHIWLDWLGVAIAGGSEPLVDILVAEALDQNGPGDSTLTGRPETLGLADAVMANAAASHALDYDDGNRQMMGHSSVVILPVLFALGEREKLSGKDVIEALLTAHETGMRIGKLVLAKEHYERGFHATSTLGGFAAAAGGARLLGLDQDKASIAMSIAGAQASGFKSVFGTMSKPHNAGRAAVNGLIGARLAKRGFTAPPDLLGTRQGFCDSFGTDFRLEEALARPPQGFHIFDNWFKFHAACQTAHATIEASRALRNRHKLLPDQIRSVTLHVPIFADRVCNIQEPTSGLELKFSIRAAAALALLGLETGDPAIYSDEIAADPGFVELRDRIRVDLSETQEYGLGLVEATLSDGTVATESFDNELNRPGIAEQGPRLVAKFRNLTAPIIGRERSEELEQAVLNLETIDDFTALSRLCTPTRVERSSPVRKVTAKTEAVAMNL